MGDLCLFSEASSIAVRPPEGEKGEAQDGSTRCNTMELYTRWRKDVSPIWKLLAATRTPSLLHNII